MKPQQHVVIVGNEPNSALFGNKEIWLLELGEDAHLENRCVWHFPTEPPSVRAHVGSLGRLNAEKMALLKKSKCPNKLAQLQMILAWKQEGIKIWNLQDMTPAKRRKIEDLSPGTKDSLNRLLRKASLGEENQDMAQEPALQA